MRRINQKSFGVDVDSKLCDEFTEQYIARGFKKYRTLEGALRLWLTLSSHEQTQWVEGKVKPAFSADPSENEIYIELDEIARRFASVNEKIRQTEKANPKFPLKRKVAL